MPLKTEGEIAAILASIREAYSQLETEYELQRAMLHEKAAENAKLREALEEIQRIPFMALSHVSKLSEIRRIAREALEENPRST